MAEAAMDTAAERGHWVILQNIHLTKKWLPTLEKKMDYYAENSHENYRIFISAESAASAAAHIIPQGILESSIKACILFYKYYIFSISFRLPTFFLLLM